MNSNNKIAYDGKGMPVDETTEVEVRLRDGTVLDGQARDFDWSWAEKDPENDIIGYTVIL